MKKQFILMLISSLLMSGTVMAQQQRRQRPQKMEPKEQAERMTEHMTKVYQLNEEQKQQLMDANLKWAEEQQAQMEDMRKNAQKQREQGQKKREEMKAQREAYDAQLQKIMTEQQYEAYKENMKKQGDRRKRSDFKAKPRGGQKGGKKFPQKQTSELRR